MATTLERRLLSVSQVRATEFSSSDGKGPGTLVGYASVFNHPTRIADQFIEQVHPQCFDRALRDGDDVRCLYNHDANAVLGRTRAGTLRLSTDNYGLRDECDLPDTTYARDLMASVTRGDVSSQSFGFQVEDDAWDEVDDPENSSRRIPRRTLRSCKLLDVSFVVFPQYDGTSVHARSRNFETLFPSGDLPKSITARFGATEFRARFEASQLAPSRAELEHRIQAVRLW